MQIVLAVSALVGFAIGIQGGAWAQNAPVYRYCLQEAGGGIHGGAAQLLCRYNTLAKCMASRTSSADLCYLNPAYKSRK
jgi:hypothetical protein